MHILKEESMLKLSSIVAAAIVLCAAAMPNVVLTGAAKDCQGRTYVQVPGVTVAAFNPTKNRKMVDLLKAMDTASFVDGDTAAMTRFGSKYSQLVGLVTTSTALARATSSSTGDFSLTFAALDSALVVGYADVEDEPYYYSYGMVGGRANSVFALDMSRGVCHYP
jgi:hypothetical protein